MTVIFLIHPTVTALMKHLGMRRGNALIVVPKSVLYQWKAELTGNFLQEDALKVIVFYGPQRKKITTNE